MDPNDYIKWFSDLKEEGHGLEVAGGKGANLGLLWNQGFPVPNGFVVNANAFKHYLSRTHIRDKIEKLLSPENLDVNDNNKLEEVSKALQHLIKSTPIPIDITLAIKEAYNSLHPDATSTIAGTSEKKSQEEEKTAPSTVPLCSSISSPKYVAVRSSATAEDLPEASFAGQHDSFINIDGADEVVANILSCWASLYTSRAIFYRVKHNFDHMKVYIAAVVQLMVNSEKAGVMFTANPTNNDLNTIMIEAVYGLGDYLVGGTVNPDSYLVDKEKKEILNKCVKPQYVGLYRNIDRMNKVKKETKTKPHESNNNNKYTENHFNEERQIPLQMQMQQVLTDLQIRSLAHVGDSIEKFYTCPQDIEWAIEDGELYITQTRNITTLQPQTFVGDQVQGYGNNNSSRQLKIDVATTFSPDLLDSKVLIIGESASPGIVSGKVKIVQTSSDLEHVLEGDILVADMTTPDWVPTMVRAGGIITDRGGVTCHAAIVSREMGIPCIVGTNTGTTILKENEMVTLDSLRGLVFEGEIKMKLNKHEEIKMKVDTADKSDNVDIDGQTTDEDAGRAATTTAASSMHTKIKLIVDLPQYASRAISIVGGVDKVDGVGLVRMEMIIATGGVHPAEYLRKGKITRYIKLLKDGIRTIAKSMEGRPIWIRTSDLRSDEYRGLKGGDQEPTEHDPMLGWHGIRRSIDDPDIMRAEFTAIGDIFREGYNVGVMIPFVINLKELTYAKQIMQEDIGLIPVQEISFGIMVETPAACWIIKELCEEGMSFISFGTNDLTQLSLGLDRNNEKLGKHFNEMHPAILGQMKKVMDVCNEYNVETSICGQAGSKEVMAKFLVENHVGSISINADAYEKIRRTILGAEKQVYKPNN